MTRIQLFDKPADPLKWRQGWPPHVGWWVASVSRDARAWRWWDGNVWSEAVSHHAGARGAALLARRPFPASGRVEWLTYYPANARVPRIAP